MNGAPLAFYDLDGTLVSSNVVTQYAWYARHQPGNWRAVGDMAKLLLSVPLLIALDLYSRRLFNEVFYRYYRGMSEQTLIASSQAMFESVLRPAIYPGATALVEADRRDGYRAVLVTGSLDFALDPVRRHFGFDELLCNRLVFENGLATGVIAPPVLAGAEKAGAVREICRKYNVETAQCKAYSDSLSDLPMLEAVGFPIAANPGRRLRRVAQSRGWPVVDLKRKQYVHAN